MCGSYAVHGGESLFSFGSRGRLDLNTAPEDLYPDTGWGSYDVQAGASVLSSGSLAVLDLNTAPPWDWNPCACCGS
jgi:hypothetical protein